MREKLLHLHMGSALHTAKLSHCARAQHACVLTSLDGERVLAFGYNGTWRGGPNTCTGPDEPGVFPPKPAPGKCECIHAEVNALIKGREDLPFVAFVTTSPCVQCAKCLINSGCKRVVCGSVYRSTEGIALLQGAGMEVSFL